MIYKENGSSIPPKPDRANSSVRLLLHMSCEGIVMPPRYGKTDYDMG